MAELDVVGVGNALVDVLADTDEDFLKAHDLSLIHISEPTRPY